MCKQPHFREVQRITQWWAWVLIIAAAGFTWYVAVRHFAFNSPLGTNPPSDVEMAVLWVAFGVLMPMLIWSMRLITEVDDDGVSTQFVPIHLRPRRFAHDEIECAVVRRYRPIREYGGWGIRLGWRGWAYTMWGSRGVELTFRSGKRLLIGSQKVMRCCGPSARQIPALPRRTPTTLPLDVMNAYRPRASANRRRAGAAHISVRCSDRACHRYPIDLGLVDPGPVGPWAADP